jgi:hypothetical protein
MFEGLRREWRRARLLIKERSRIVDLARKLTPAEREASLAVVYESDRVVVHAHLVELAGYLNRATRGMLEEKREAFIDAAAVKTKPSEIRALIVAPDGSARFYTVEVA